MINYLINSEEDITLLTCKKCAFGVYEALLDQGCKFMQDKERIIREIRKADKIIEITKLIAESKEEDVFFLFSFEAEEYLRDRTVIIDTCVEDFVDEESIPAHHIKHLPDHITHEEIAEFVADLMSIEDEDEFEDECDCEDMCDECCVVAELLESDPLDFEEALRLSYRAGKIAAIVDVIEDLEEKLF